MPIRPENLPFYPIDWVQLSESVRFRRAGGRCEGCGIAHGTKVSETYTVRLACCHLNHDLADCRPQNLKAFCQVCHLKHDREEHRRQRRITILLRRALGDLFEGVYRRL
jgi:hypothetical protein